MNSDTSLTDKETRVCEGCGHSWSAKHLKADGYVACCPERKMLTAREWYERAQVAEAHRNDLADKIVSQATEIGALKAIKEEASEQIEALKARARTAEEALKADGRQKRAYLDEIDRQKVKLAEQRGVLEWIANHRNDSLTDGSAATRTCLDEIVNLAAAALSATAPAAPSLPAWKPTDLAVYTVDEALQLRVEIVGPVEGWWEVRHIGGSTAIVRPSRLAPFADRVAGEEHDVTVLFDSPEEAAMELAKGDSYAALAGLAPPAAVAEQTDGEA